MGRREGGSMEERQPRSRNISPMETSDHQIFIRTLQPGQEEHETQFRWFYIHGFQILNKVFVCVCMRIYTYILFFSCHSKHVEIVLIYVTF